MNRICPKCKSPYKTTKCWKCYPKKAGRHYTGRWNALSKRYRTINPLCEDCEKYGRVTPCSEVHHIVPLEEDPDGLMDWHNLVALCKFCHQYRHGKAGDRREE